MNALKTFRPRLESLARSRVILLLLGLYLLLTFVVFPFITGELGRLSGGASMLDMQFSYTPQQAFQAVEAYGEQGRPLYGISSLTADLLYPVVYSLLLALVMIYTFRRAFSPQSPLQGTVYLPFFTALADYLENASVVVLLASYPQRPEAVAQAANVFTSLKWGLLLVSMLLAVIGIVAWRIKK
jgi:hypothetical protein